MRLRSSIFWRKVKLKDGEIVLIRFLQLNDLLYLDEMYASLLEQTRLLFHPPIFRGNLFVRLIEKFKFIMSCSLTLRKVLLKIFPRAVVIPIVAVNKNSQIIALSYIKILNWLPHSTYFGVGSSVVTDKYQNRSLGY